MNAAPNNPTGRVVGEQGPTPAGSVAGLPRPRRSPGRAGGSRDQYIDGLRALALVRVVTYHTFGWIWLPVIFPSMGVMFALGGSLVAASLSRAPGKHWTVLRKRARRLLPPLWLYGTVLVTAMVVNGWTTTETAGTPLTWSAALAWIVPLSDPPGSAWGYDFVLPLWYIRTYLWLLLLSPTLLWLFRRYPRLTMLAPVGLLAVIAAGGLDTTTSTGDTLEKLATFGACWLLGFAHHDGRIRALARRWTVLAGVVLMAVGYAYARSHPQLDTAWDLDNIPLADALYSAGAVVLLLRLYPRRTFLERMPRLSALVATMNSRAMTIYLWGNAAIWAATPVIESTPWTRSLEVGGIGGEFVQFAVAWLVLVVAVLAFGWAEDVAAGRRPRINPWPRASANAVGAAKAPGAAGTSKAAGAVVARPADPVSGGSARGPARQPARRPAVMLPAMATCLLVSLAAGVAVTGSAAGAALPLQAGLPVAASGASASGPSLSGSSAAHDSTTVGSATGGSASGGSASGNSVSGSAGTGVTEVEEVARRGSPGSRVYPLHSGILATVFRIGAVTQTGSGEDGQSLSSAWDARWATHYGGCDGIGKVGSACAADAADRIGPDWFPAAMTPRENPYYVGLPYNDLLTRKSVDRRRIPWASDPGYAARVTDRSVSFLKNRWVAVTGPSGTCYAQVEDTGPGTQDPDYVIGSAAPKDRFGINLSPAVTRCIGVPARDGDGATVAWRFVDQPPGGAWTTLVTTRQVS